MAWPWSKRLRPAGALPDHEEDGMGSGKARELDGGSMHAYRRSLANVQVLDRETERDLARRWIAGDKRAGRKIVEACLPFVVSIAVEYRRWGVPLEDIVQQGNVGLLKAAQKFDPSRDCRLATYAAYWIRAEIREYVVRAFRVVRLGTTKGERRALRMYRKTKLTDPAALAEASGLSEERVRLLLPLLASREMSLDASTSDSGPATERLPGTTPTPEEEAARSEARTRAGHAVHRAVGRLDDRERMIVQERLMNEEPPTLQELGARLGVSKERVRQLEERARSKLRGELAELADLVA
ncbi:MAG: sigma-70 family RNA polymerase sigma factor [Labilithrix sp.]|nr:sigma-70 family RNA polymerase sigma factor [Labilithrix sp.]